MEDFEREDIEETLKDLLLERFDCVSLLGQQLPARADAVRFRVTVDLLTVLHGQEPTTKKHIEFFEDEGVFHAICAWINGRTWSSSEPAPTFSERGAAIFGERQEVDRDRFVRSQYTIERVEPDGNNWRPCPWARRQRRHYLDRLNQPESAMVWLEDWGEMPNFRDEV
ncbi:MAG: hypothetical protein NTZ11_17535 [Gammaproteobacteria bacterium]|nr:hypothetical protein [Gammaproteobacteria bacterium]